MCKYLYILALAVLVSCGETPISEQVLAETQQAPETAVAYSPLDVFNIDGAISLPDMSTRGVNPTMTLNDITGMLDIQVGRGFYLQMREEDQQLDSFVSDWELDPVWKHQVIKQDDQYVLYSKELADGSMQHFHFLATIKDADRSMMIRSTAMEEFSQEEVEQMLASALTFKWNTDLAQINTNE